MAGDTPDSTLRRLTEEDLEVLGWAKEARRAGVTALHDALKQMVTLVSRLYAN